MSVDSVGAKFEQRFASYGELPKSEAAYSLRLRKAVTSALIESTEDQDRVSGDGIAPTCPTCGSRIETTSVGDLGCIACLIATGLDAEAEQSNTAFASTPNQLGAYTIEHRPDGSAWELGHGAMGVTYRAIDKALDRPIALKIINTDGASHSTEARERFMREARAAAALRHANVATVYQFGVREETGQFFYAMELLEGETLEERVRRLGPLDVLTTIHIALQVTAALEAAEERGVVHRDLKPGNLMLVARDGEEVGRPRGGVRTSQRDVPTIKVIDFGVAKAVAEKTNAMAITHGGFVGTPAFASPEQFTNAPVDVRSDIYSLGVTLWFLLTGHLLFSGRTIEQIQSARRSKQLPVEQLKAARVPRRLISLLMSMLASEPAARPAGARELSVRLQAIRTSITGRGKTARRLALAAAIVALATIVAVREFRATKAPPPPIPEKSVAVLPFENISDDPNNAYLVEGIQEEILTRLASIADLKVISRSSTQRYHSKPGNLAEVAKQLGVANIVEGSAQKTADQVRVNVQLIKAQTDSQLWADTYERKFTDIFGVESEIAKGIAESLRAKLTGREQQALAVKPTNNPEAYDAYLRGVAFDARSIFIFSTDLTLKAIGFYERAVQLDPNFAVAWARLSCREGRLYFDETDTAGTARRDAAKRALDNAQKLAPNSPETLLALGYYQYWVLRDYGAAKATFGRVKKMLPNSSEVLLALARISRRQGHWDESIAYSERALAIDPRNVQLLIHTAETYSMVRQFPAALKLYDRASDIGANDPGMLTSKASMYLAQGKLPEAAGMLSEINWQTDNEDAFTTKITQLSFERNYGEAIRLLRARQAQFHFVSDYQKAFDCVALAFVHRLAGDTAAGKATAEHARNTLERLCRHQPENVSFRVRLSLAYAAMGEKDLSLKAADHAIMLLPSAKDAVDGPGLEENLAVIEMMFGENSRAISTLTRLLKTPYLSWLYGPAPITPGLLRLDPIWDPLRADPVFQKLCDEKIDKSIAVLPFADLSQAHDQEYFCDGISEEILDALSKVKGLRVVARTSSFSFKGKNIDAAEVGQKLNVRYLLEGSLRREGNRVRITAQLINAPDGFHIWSDTFERESQGVFALQDEITRAIVDALKVKLAVAPTSRIPQNPEAYDLYLQGLHFSNKSDQESLQKSLTVFQRALDIDPNFAPAWTGIAKDWYTLADAYVKPLEAYPKMMEAASKAVALDERDAEAHAYLGTTKRILDRDLLAEGEELKRALEIDPNSAPAHFLMSLTKSAQGELQEGIKEIQEAERLDPLSPIICSLAVGVYLAADRPDDAINAGKRMLQLDPNYVYLDAALADAYREKGDFKEAVALYEKAQAARQFPSAGLAITYARMGRREDARHIVDQLIEKSHLQYVAADSIATVYIALAEKDEAFRWLDRAYHEHSAPASAFLFHPEYRAVRSDPRFADLLRRTGIDPAKVQLLKSAIPEKNIGRAPRL